MKQLRAARSLGLTDWCIAAGFVRNRVWDHLHGIAPPTPLADIDVLYYDAWDLSKAPEQAYEARLNALEPAPWQVRNQARMHVWKNLPQHKDTADSMIYWLETVLPDGTVRISSHETIEKYAHGITQSLILCAHTHIARAVRLRDGRLIVNPGSVGSPGYRDVHPFPHVVEAGTPDARYAILELAAGGWHVSFRHVPYDHEAMASLARKNGHPDLAHALATGWIA